MNIRKATLNDADGIGVVLKESYNIDSLEEGKSAFIMELQKGVHYIVAEDNGKILGIVTWYFHGLPKHELVELDRIAVLPDFRGKGIAERLFKSLIDDANNELNKHGKKLRKLFLMTHASNERAQKFYEKLGMRHETTLNDHYYKGEDEWVYSMFF